jgi:hypothetical protein
MFISMRRREPLLHESFTYEKEGTLLPESFTYEKEGPPPS